MIVQEQMDELCARFSKDFAYKCVHRNALYQKVFDALLHGADVYTLLETVIDTLDEVNTKFTEHLKYGPPPVYIGEVPKRLIKEMQKNKKKS